MAGENTNKIVDMSSLDNVELARTYNGLMHRADDDDERRRVMAKFEAECPGLLDFIHAVDAAEKDRVLEDGTDEEKQEVIDAPNEFTRYAYGMLMGCLTLKEVTDTANFNSMFGL